MGILGGQKINKSPGNVMNCPEINTICFYPSHPGGFQRGGVGGQNFKSSVNFMNCRENREFFFTPPPPPKGVAVGILGGKKIKSPGNVMNCREK